ncbi:hypothetical protein D9757_006507 [Collybiopsis confluens]|uniref:Uncharacterized protein n=1 Tax=Collybiopsis confluens TaxID=2823264 RepID=A0A8H5HQ48_9AGAR|nr:hypothetical protein D9757_006507 [Collybiopsis confluens]
MVYIVGGAITTVVLTPLLGPAILGMAGFGSAAAAIQIPNVVAGSMFAGAQAAGATGVIPAIGYAISGGVGAGAVAIVKVAYNTTY